jgi:ABC-type antimicrobial peptide transport system permease subunit
MKLVLTRVALLVGAGIVLGAGASAWASPLVASLLYGLPPRDPSTFVAAALLLAGVGLLAGWLPARRAMRLDPVAILRSE